VITHLAQIAAYADNHYKVSKAEKNKRTVTALTKIEGKERVQELASMMSGEKISDVSIKHAKDMLARPTRNISDINNIKNYIDCS